MAITYTWKLTSFKISNTSAVENAIFQTYWEKIGTDENGNTGKFIGATPFDAEAVDPNKFIPYAELTEEIVLSWVKPVVTGDYEKHVNEQIAKQISAKISVPQEVSDQSFPWLENPAPLTTPGPVVATSEETPPGDAPA